MKREMFSIITMASSTTKPVEMVSAISVRLLRRVAQQVHHAERAHDRQRHRDRGNDGGGQVAQEEEDDHHHQRDGEHQLKFDVLH